MTEAASSLPDHSREALWCDQLSFGYGERLQLDQVNLRLTPGEVVAVVGPNGGGKTTLLKLILGLLKAQKGRVSVFGEPVEQVRHRVGYVPQSVNLGVGLPVSVAEVVAMGLTAQRRAGVGQRRSQGFSWPWQQPSHERDAVAAALLRVKAEHLLTRPYAALSGGQRQRVLIARALVSEPDMLIFDEPTANIDAQGTYCFFESLSSFSKALTVLLVSHDFAVTAPLINSVAVVNQRLLYNDEPFLTDEMMRLIYGEHHANCPVGCFLQDLSKAIGAHQHHVH